MEEFRNEVYNWSLDLVREGKTYEGIFLLLSTWNFAYFRYHMKEFSLKKFKEILESCDFEYFQNKTFRSSDFSEPELQEKIKEIYDKLSSLIGIKYVGATKILHLMCPRFFVMWDTKIRKLYNVGTSPTAYLKFIAKMKENYESRKFNPLDKRVSIPRGIDIKNMKLTENE